MWGITFDLTRVLNRIILKADKHYEYKINLRTAQEGQGKVVETQRTSRKTKQDI